MADVTHVLPHTEDTLRFLLAGKCYVTVEDIAEETRCTYQVSQKTKEMRVLNSADLAGACEVDYIEGTPEDLAQGEACRVFMRYPLWFVSLVPGAIDDTRPKYLGVIDEKRAFRTTKATCRNVSATADNINTFGDLVANLHDGKDTSHKIRIWHQGRCGRCARSLSTPESIATGLGPVCAKTLGVKMADVTPNIIEKLAALAD